MIIVPVNNQSTHYDKLQAFIGRHQLLFNSAPWLQNYPAGKLVQCAVLNNNEEVIGCFSYYRFKKNVFSCAISAPFTPNIALFYVNPSESVVGKNSFNKEVLAALADYFDGLKLSLTDLNLPESIIDTQPLIWKGYSSHTRYSYLIDLSQAQETLWDNLSSQKRKSVNKAAKDGLVIKESNDYELIHTLIIQSLKRNGLYKNTEVIRRILFSFASPNNSFSYVAYQNNRPIGATFCVIDGGKAVYLFGGFDADNKHHGAGVSCMWHSILKARSLQLRYFDFEGSMNADIERYFREFGGNIVPYYNIQKINPFLRTLFALKKYLKA